MWETKEIEKEAEDERDELGLEEAHELRLQLQQLPLLHVQRVLLLRLLLDELLQQHERLLLLHELHVQLVVLLFLYADIREDENEFFLVFEIITHHKSHFRQLFLSANSWRGSYQ
jgi:hypothetical protein